MYERNLNILKKFHPEVYKKIINENSNLKVNIEFKNNVLKINNLSCYSKYNPEKEAERIVERWEKDKKDVENVVVFGFSNPFIIKKIIKKYNVSIFIPDVSAFKEVLKFLDFTEIFEKVDKIIFNNNIPYNEFEIFKQKIEEKFYSTKLELDKSFIKVLLVNPIYGGSLPICKYIESNLKKFNVKLKVINSEIFHGVMNYIKNNFSLKRNESKSLVALVNLVSEIILNTIEEFNPDILFGVAQSPINFKVLNLCKNRGILKIFWFMEDYKLFTYWKQFACHYDYYFTIQKDEFFHELKKIGVKNYYYLPVAAEPSVHRPLNLSKEEKKYYGSTISFVGAGYYNRKIFFRDLIDYDFKIWGSDWDGEILLKEKIQENGRRVTPEEYVKIFNASLININLHSSTYLTGVDPDGDFVNPRTFEIAATNSIQLVDRRKYLPEVFEYNKEILVFSNINELKGLINKIIKDPEKYREIAENGYKKILNFHTYEHRLKEMFNVIGYPLKYVNFKEGSLDFYLFKFNSLEEIANYISKKDNVGETETIFLLMKELKDTYLK